jgi:hypothetical protein
MTTIITPKPPLNLFEARRVTVTDTWTTIYEVPDYRIPARGPDPQRDIQAAAILTSLLVSNTSSGVAKVSVRVKDTEGNFYFIIVEKSIAKDFYEKVEVDKQVLQSTETIEIQMDAGNTAEAHLSFILNQREEFTVLV